ncbi:6,7-dimethyl-8-ribityllumazine synthase [Verrucomicrobiaceae bacterium N1E253]|uniref:6,7-dimethyl-8-ribityllumazine synthase n=1 Tax=Oceaniferula marina TaxID=2748318 RepID=A0A851GEZ1_9BACT|nr:6,7-dimethyl-8-ribityllumazine synthase [Oceaniferula marina]NWK55462.1 6,7-dimethyl-8-ribityllumazine synthase [Oceaniferula marina]
MSTALPTRPRSLNQRSQIVIVASTYNEEFTDALVENCKQELEELMPNSLTNIIRVPGAYEVPVTVEALIQQNKPECVITLGLIIRGQTAHGDLVAESVTNALQEIAVRNTVPVIHEVVLVDDDKQAYARCIGSKLNRGREAARAATSILDTFNQFKRSTGRVFPSNA